MPQSSPSKLIPLDRIDAESVGGKAAQLAQLIRLGLRVPEGFVIVGASPGNLPAELDEYSTRLGGAVAVRSSALGEDSANASFAGQFETVLGVQGAPAIRRAVEQCLVSAANARAQAYRDQMHRYAAMEMAVVVQRMVEASAAGVIFTIDPVSGQRERVVVEAVQGSGEGLVGGHRTADRFVLSRDAIVIERNVQGEHAALDDATLERLLRDALKAERGLGYALDLEWAIGHDGQVHWLQARPITTLELAGPDELDDEIDPSWPLTTHNVAEWMPGAMSPLSWSVVGPSYIRGMTELCVRAGVKRELIERVPCLVNVQGHALINMATGYLLGTQMFGMDKESYDLTLTGMVQPEAKLPPDAPFLQRLVNTMRYARLAFAGSKRLDAFVAQQAFFRVEPTENLVEYYQRLEQAVRIYDESGLVHVHTSMTAIALLNLFQRVLSKGRQSTPQVHAAVAALLSGARSAAPNAPESSIGVTDALDKLGALIAAQPEAAAHFARAPLDQALQWLRSPAAGPAQSAFDTFLSMHGHRCIRELDFRERDWSEDPLPLIQSLQQILAAPRTTKTDWTSEAQAALAPLSWGARWLLQWLLPKAHVAVVERERSKSFSVWLARQLKRGYMQFAHQLVARGDLPDTDLIYFFTHEELGRLARGQDAALVRRAEHRRRLHPQKVALELPRVCKGKPTASSALEGSVQIGDAMQGTPLSRGVAVGCARVARTLEEAASMQPGEILVTPFTDVGWTPFFSRAAGLATEVGSVLSHGAVVAREYGLPAIAGLPGVTRWIKTGDRLRLDANTGELRRLG